MARNPVIRWSAVLVKAYRGNISDFRQRLDEIYDWLLRSPQAKPDVEKTIREFAENAGLDVDAPTPATAVLISDGQKVNAGSVIGTGDFATFTVAGGVITGIALTES